MGTNYYVTVEPPCPTCGRGGEDAHVGKSSAGWRFLFASYRDRGIISASDWKEVIEVAGGFVHDEYGGKLSLEEFFDKVERKQDSEHPTNEDFGPGGREPYEYDDEEGYRISRTFDFS